MISRLFFIAAFSATFYYHVLYQISSSLPSRHGYRHTISARPCLATRLMRFLPGRAPSGSYASATPLDAAIAGQTIICSPRKSDAATHFHYLYRQRHRGLPDVLIRHGLATTSYFLDKPPPHVSPPGCRRRRPPMGTHKDFQEYMSDIHRYRAGKALI